MFRHSSKTAARCGLALAFGLSMLCQQAGAQPSAETYPDKPVRIVVPFAAGAGTDAMGRLVALKLTEVLGGSFLV